ncbi:MAG: carbon-nitrogen hydrolase family protein, partial [Planctomycetes bacterium]|nr:carbon-nitrogen hydrolase family protein [Planctomycetota bacterium]
DELVARAADEHADLVLLPECVWPAYFIGSVEEYFRARETGLPGDDAFLEQLTHLARTHDIAICAGYVAEHERRLSNAATLISATGEVLGTHRKCFLWDFDYTFFEPGSELSPLQTPWGPVGLMICADARLPEIPATLVARGARLILHATAWVNVGTPEELWNPQPALLIPERAREFGLPIASASKWGVEGNTTFVGSSLICGANGEVLVQCGTRETNVIVADVSLEVPRRPQLTPPQRARLLSSQPATPVFAQVPPLRVGRVGDRSRLDAALERLRSDSANPTLFVVDGPNADPLLSDAGLLLSGPTESIHDLAGIRIAAVQHRDVSVFAPIRVLALEGVHVVVVFGQGVSKNALRSRAAENRVFLVHVTPRGISAYGPSGGAARTARACDRISSRTKPEADVLTLDVAQSADKEFAPRTNPFAARRPECYEF